MLNHLLTFAIFLLIGIEIRDGLSHFKATILPSVSALGGMIFPALIFLLLSENNQPWATVMPTDVALAIGALSLLGSRVNPSVKIFLMTLAVADDLFSLIAIGIFFRNDLDISSAFYTIGAAVIGALLPYRHFLLRVLNPVITFVVIPAYIWINLFAEIDYSTFDSPLALAIVGARVIGKVVGITLFTYLMMRFTSLSLPSGMNIREVAGVGLLCGMGMTVSLVIAEITIESSQVLSEIRSGLFIGALLSALLGLTWLKRFPAVR